jgi:hypothetical protein
MVVQQIERAANPQLQVIPPGPGQIALALCPQPHHGGVILGPNLLRVVERSAATATERAS